MTMRMLHVLDERAGGATSRSSGSAEEQTALRRVATLVARGVPPAEVFSAVAEEVGRLLGADATIMLRFDADEMATVVAALGVKGEDLPPGSRWKIEPSMAMAAIVRTGRSARIDDYSDVAGALAEVLRRQGVRSAVATPDLGGGAHLGRDRRRGPGASRSAPTPSSAWRPSPSSSRRRSRTPRRGPRCGDSPTSRPRCGASRRWSPARLRRARSSPRWPPRWPGCSARRDMRMFRFEDDGTATVWPSGGRRAGAAPHRGPRGPAEVGDLVGVLRRTGSRPVPRSRRSADSLARGRHPIVVRGRSGARWSSLAAEEPLPAGTEARVGEFTELVATAISNVEARSELAASRARIVEAAERSAGVSCAIFTTARSAPRPTVMNSSRARAAMRRRSRGSLVEEGLAHARAAIDELGELARGILRRS